MSDTGARIGGRVGFDSMEQLDKRFRSIDFPVELAIPWKYDDLWLAMEHRVEEVADFFQDRDIEILSIHVPREPITEESFLSWVELGEVIRSIIPPRLAISTAGLPTRLRATLGSGSRVCPRHQRSPRIGAFVFRGTS